MDLIQFVQERLSRGAQQAQQLISAASTLYRKRNQAPLAEPTLARFGSSLERPKARLDARAVVSIAAAYRRAYVVSRELQTPSS
jgi:hypothetical protein